MQTTSQVPKFPTVLGFLACLIKWLTGRSVGPCIDGKRCDARHQAILGARLMDRRCGAWNTLILIKFSCAVAQGTAHETRICRKMSRPRLEIHISTCVPNLRDEDQHDSKTINTSLHLNINLISTPLLIRYRNGLLLCKLLCMLNEIWGWNNSDKLCRVRSIAIIQSQSSVIVVLFAW
jgi:hypothetical protein